MYKNLPSNPGVYLFKDDLGNVIYVGKSKNLKKRVKSYFQKDQSYKNSFLVKKIKSIDYFIVDNEVEALLLENRLIKKYQPKYNILLKDSKTYAYITLTKEDYPRVYSARKSTKKDYFFGPYTNSNARKQVVYLVNSLFKLRTCRKMPKRACLQYHINLCTAPCINNVTKKEYLEQVKQAHEFLRGNTKPIVEKLKKEMMQASKKQKFEVALEKRNYLQAIEVLNEKQKVDQIKDYNQHVISMYKKGNKATIIVFAIEKGVLSNKNLFNFDYNENLLEEFIPLYYIDRTVPREIIVEKKISYLIIKGLEKLRGGIVKITIPKKGDKLKLLELAKKNAKIQSENTILIKIKDKLNLAQIPIIVECFDISNLGDKHIVGAMTQWVGGFENKKEHRKYLIRGQDYQNDFLAMQQVVYRRYKYLKFEKLELPDLILIDGGKGQLNAALKSLKILGLNIPIISIAKQDEEIYVPWKNNPINLDNNSDIMLLLRKMRDSVHRFVLAYNRKRRSMEIKN